MVCATRLVAARPSDRSAGPRPGRAIGLLIAPTGAGKTLAGFLPSLSSSRTRPKRKPGEALRGIHTLYISPLKALAVDIERNLGKPVGEIGLPITIETRTGDTPAHKRQRQKLAPPDILLTTPEQLALLIAAPDAQRFFEDLRYVVLRRTAFAGDVEARPSAVARPCAAAALRARRPDHRPVGDGGRAGRTARAGWSARTRRARMADLIAVAGGAKPDITILDSRGARAVGRALGPLRHAGDL